MENKTNKKDFGLWIECLTVIALATTLTFINCHKKEDDKTPQFAAAALASRGSGTVATATGTGTTYTVGGTITGLSATGLVLQNNAGDDLTVASGATSFTFATAVTGAYAVTVKTQPTGLTCTVSNGTGTAVANVTNVSATCSAITFTIGGTITGLTASGLVLQNNAGDDLTVASGATSFTFATKIATGAAYAVTVKTQPTAAFCKVSSGSGTVSANVTNVTLTCGSLMGGAIQLIISSLTGAVTTFAGPSAGTTTSGDTDGIGNAARFNGPTGITTDGTNLYIAEASNNKIRQIVISTGAVSTLAGPSAGTTTSGDTDGTGNAARFNLPSAITTDGTNLFVADAFNAKIRKIVISTGVVTTLAGPAQGSTTTGDADGTGNAARFNPPQGITTDGTNLYVADSNNNKIRRIVISTGVVTTLAGPAAGTTTSGNTDGTGNAARFNNPKGITTDGTNLYIGDATNHRIRKIVISTGVVTTIAGSVSGTADGTGTAALFNNPNGLVSDGTNLFNAGFGYNRVRKIVISSTVVTTLAGNTSSSGDTDGTGTAALFNGLTDITTDGTSLFVADKSNNKIRKIQ